MLFEKREVSGSNQDVVPKTSNLCWLLEVTRFENWLNFQNACAVIVWKYRCSM